MLKTQTQPKVAPSLDVKVIKAEGIYKGLVLDMTKREDRLHYISSGETVQEAVQDATEFLEAVARHGLANVWQ